ncbi:2OG-Fe(II) oxygenase [Marinobacteraceae bacterium S3BR75-40.1]
MLAQVKNRILFRSRYLNVYFVRYPEGHKVVPHVDMIAGGQLYKLNCVVRQPKEGGHFECERNLFNLFDRIVLFRPDLHRHSVSKIQRGSRWLLSFALNTAG